MTCGNCAERASAAARSVPGVEYAEANPQSGSLEIKWSQGASPDPAAVAAAVTNAGYPTQPLQSPGPHDPKSPSQWPLSSAVSLTAAFVMMAGEWIGRIHHDPWFQSLSWVLASIAMCTSGRAFALGAWRQARAYHFGMDALVTLGASTAYLYSTVAWLTAFPGHLYFMECTAILGFISLGHWLENRISARAESALRQLLVLSPQTTRRLRPDGSAEEIPATLLKPSDHIIVRPGENIPCDGEVLEGDTEVDESLLTGESRSVTKGPGTKVAAGTLNLRGQIKVRADSVGEETGLAAIIRVVRRAQASRANIQRIADRISQVFVPCVVVIALASFALWTFLPDQARAAHEFLAQWLWLRELEPSPLANGLIQMAAVLIIACPCAMGLATPAALMAATNAAARRGILLRDAPAIEKAGRIDTVVFDKTGTLTLPGLSVTAYWFRDPSAATRWMPILLELAGSSNHPVSKAVALFAKAQHSPSGVSRTAPQSLTELREHPGSGVSAQLPPAWNSSNPTRAEALLGSPTWLQSRGINLSAVRAFQSRGSDAGMSYCVFTIAGEVEACFSLRTGLRQEAGDVVSALQKAGIKVLILSGDQRDATLATAEVLGLSPDHAIHGVSPEHKADFIRNLQTQGRKVAFIGDGLNDGPALAQSDLGIAVSGATDVARESADIVILHPDLRMVPVSLNLSKATLRIIHQNFFWALAYNVASIPLAALGFMNPLLCALAMGLSDLLVITNSLRLLRNPGDE